MAPPLLALRGARAGFGGAPLFEDVDVEVGRGDRTCLVGRNGGGKSTLLKALSGQIDIETGERFLQPGTRVAYLPQETAFLPEETVADHVGSDGAELHRAAALPQPVRSRTFGDKCRCAAGDTLAPTARTSVFSCSTARLLTGAIADSVPRMIRSCRVSAGLHALRPAST